MKRLSIFLITVALIAGMVGCGPPSQDLEIRDWYDLDAIRDNPGGHHRLMNDLDSTTAGYKELASPTANREKGWEPIGTLGRPFTGSFDGRGYEIRDLFINLPDEYCVGLFGAVGQEGVVENIGTVNVIVTGKVNVGGLVGQNTGTVSNSYSTGSVTGYDGGGGLVGKNRDGIVISSYSTGSVTGDDGVGGLVGINSEGTVSNSYSTSSATSDVGVGGLVGVNYYGSVTHSYSTGNVTGEAYVGGLVGYNKGSVSNSFWDMVTSGMEESDGGTGNTRAEMQDIATFSGAAWEIITVANPSTRNPSYIWNIVNGVTYPFLSWES